MVEGCASVPPRSDQDFRYERGAYRLELTNLDVIGDQIKLTFLYTNKTNSVQRGMAWQPETYLLDNFLNRHESTQDSLGWGPHSFPPGVPEKIWFAFQKADPRADWVTFRVRWRIDPRERDLRDFGIEIGPPQSDWRDFGIVRIPTNWKGAGPPTEAVALPPTTPTIAQGFRFDQSFYSFDLTNVDVVGDQVRLTFLYTNRTDEPQRGWAWPDDTYLVDNLGNRYQYASDSLGGGQRSFPPGVPEKVWFSFGKIHPRATSVNFVLRWRVSTPPSIWVNGIIRDIPLNWARPSS